jgi:hypothetical protein
MDSVLPAHPLNTIPAVSAAISTVPVHVNVTTNEFNIINDDDDNNDITTEHEIAVQPETAASPSQQQPPSNLSVNENSNPSPQDCRRSCIKDTSHESIPLRNSGWKNLPKLTMPNLSRKLTVTEPKKCTHTKPKNTVVQFGSIEIRSYDICIGDNPSVSYGTPISLDWDYVVELKDTVEKYESIRSLTKRRNMRQMMMNYNHRRNILLLHWNVTEDALLQSEKEMNLIRSQRNMTRTLLPLAPLEDCMTSLYRKIQRRRQRQRAVQQQPQQQ